LMLEEPAFRTRTASFALRIAVTNIVERNCRTERERGHPDLASA
jgi:hypothetical protein